MKPKYTKKNGLSFFLLFLSAFYGMQGCGRHTEKPADAPAETETISQSANARKTVQLFAAAGTRAPSEEICDRFEQKTGLEVARNYASSGTLARQIAEGANADVFISANRQWIDFLIEKKILSADDVGKIAGNTLVLIAPKDAESPVPEFTPEYDIRAAIPEKIAVGDPAYVPVGKYTDAVFKKLGWLEKIKDKMILAKDVSSVLRYVELGECDFGVVYRSEALQSEKIKIVKEVPGSLHKPIEFFAAPLVNAQPEGKRLVEEVLSKPGTDVFIKHGFSAFPKNRK